jgi:hypothetical protein
LPIVLALPPMSGMMKLAMRVFSAPSERIDKLSDG